MTQILGVLGARNSLTKHILQEEILDPVFNDLNKKPTRVLLPAEPLSSTFIECWAARKDIHVDLLRSDYAAHGRRAGVLRDARIEKDATAYIVFEGPKSSFYMKLAERIAKKYPDRPVYLIASNTVSPVLLEVEQVKPAFISDDLEAEILGKGVPMGNQKKSTDIRLFFGAPTTKCLLTDD